MRVLAVYLFSFFTVGVVAWIRWHDRVFLFCLVSGRLEFDAFLLLLVSNMSIGILRLCWFMYRMHTRTTHNVYEAYHCGMYTGENLHKDVTCDRCHLDGARLYPQCGMHYCL